MVPTFIVFESNPAGQIISDYSRVSGPAIALPQAEHQAIPNIVGGYIGSARDLLAGDIRNLRNYTNAPNSSLQQLIDINKAMYPSDFAR